jgi:glycosyltransferase involved in cell wall biosynthesis
VLFLNWRDVAHPEGGGSERYVESVAERLAAAGWEVTLLCARHAGADTGGPRSFRVVHAGGGLTVYLAGLWHLLRHRYDVVVDVQNGVPFWSRLVARSPVVVLVHHVHREVWPVAVGPVAARLGWLLESQVAPRVYRGCRYVTVSDATRAELVHLGVRAEAITVVHNGTEAWAFPDAPKEPRARLCVVGRLVPHKQVEHAIDVLAALPTDLGAELDVVGHGYWEPEIRRHARRVGVEDRVHLHGYVDDARKHALMSASWVHLCPSLKEGWGLVCIEAARHGVPTVAYETAGGVAESVRDGETGFLVTGPEEMREVTCRLLTGPAERDRVGGAAREFARRFAWDTTAEEFAAVLDDVLRDAAQRSP